MSLNNPFKRLKRIDHLIRKKGTGNAATLARRFDLSPAAIYKFIREMKELGFPISYSKKRKTYYYTEDGKMVEKLFKTEIENDEMKKINGGKSYFQFFADYTYSRV